MKTLCVLLLSCVAAYGADTKNVDKTVPLSTTGSVTLESHNGSIHVHTWDRAEIEIHARIESGGSREEDRRRFDQTTVEIDNTSSSVRIKSKYPEWNWSWFGSSGNSPQIHYTITAPSTARWTVRNHNANVEMRDVNAALNLDTHNGSARIVNLGGPLEVNAHNGKFYVDFSSFKGATLDMHNGTAELVMPSSSRFDVRSSSHNGNVDSDFSILTRTMGRRNRGSLEGSVNGGGASLRLSFHNGHVRLRRK